MYAEASLGDLISSDDEQDDTVPKEADYDPFTNAVEQQSDMLPQPYRLIDNVLNYIIDRAVFVCEAKAKGDFRAVGGHFLQSLPQCPPSNMSVLSGDQNEQLNKTGFGPGKHPAFGLGGTTIATDKLIVPGSPGFNASLGNASCLATSDDGRHAFATTLDGNLLLLTLSPVQAAYALSASMQLVEKGDVRDTNIHTLSVKPSDYASGEDGTRINQYRVAWAAGSMCGVVTVDVDTNTVYEGCTIDLGGTEEDETSKVQIEKVELSPDNYYLGVSLKGGAFRLFHLSLAVIPDGEPLDDAAQASGGAEADTFEGGSLGSLTTHNKSNSSSKTPVRNERLVIEYSLQLQLTPSADLLSYTKSLVAEEGGRMEDLKVNTHFLSSMTGRKLAAPAVLSTRSIIVWWSKDTVLYRYKLPEGSTKLTSKEWSTPVQKTEETPAPTKAAPKGGKKDKGKAAADPAKDASADAKENAALSSTPDYTWYTSHQISCSRIDISTTLLALGLKDGNVLLFDNTIGSEKMRLTPHTSPVLALDFVHQHFLISGSECGKVHSHKIGSPNPAVETPATIGDMKEIGSCVKSLNFGGPVKSIKSAGSLDMAIVTLQDKENMLAVLDVQSAVVVCTLPMNSTPSGIKMSSGEEDMNDFTFQKDSVSAVPIISSLSPDDMFFALVERDLTVGTKPPPEEKEEEESDAAAEVEKIEAEEPGAELNLTTSGEELVKQKDVVLALYSLEDVLFTAYNSIASACKNTLRLNNAAREMFEFAPHDLRLKDQTYDLFVSTHVEDSVGGRVSKNKSQGTGPKGDTSSVTSAGSRATRFGGGTRSMNNKTYSQSSVHSRVSKGSVRSKRGQTTTTDIVSVPDDPEVEDEGNPSPFNDLSRHVYEVLKKRIITRKTRTKRSKQRMDMILEALDQEQKANAALEIINRRKMSVA